MSAAPTDRQVAIQQWVLDAACAIMTAGDDVKHAMAYLRGTPSAAAIAAAIGELTDCTSLLERILQLLPELDPEIAAMLDASAGAMIKAMQKQPPTRSDE